MVYKDALHSIEVDMSDGTEDSQKWIVRQAAMQGGKGINKSMLKQLPDDVSTKAKLNKVTSRPASAANSPTQKTQKPVPTKKEYIHEVQKKEWQKQNNWDR